MDSNTLRTPTNTNSSLIAVGSGRVISEVESLLPEMPRKNRMWRLQVLQRATFGCTSDAMVKTDWQYGQFMLSL
jgi:hypothetical protein